MIAVRQCGDKIPEHVGQRSEIRAAEECLLLLNPPRDKKACGDINRGVQILGHIGLLFRHLALLSIWIGPVDVPSGDIEHRAIGQLPASGDDGSSVIQPSGFADQSGSALRSRKKSLADVVAFFAAASFGVGSYRAHVTNLLSMRSMWSR